MDSLFPLLIFQLVSCAFMTGLIVLVQIVHYPAFGFVAENQFAQFHGFHTKNITWIVLPVMLLELGTASALVFFSSEFLLQLNLFLLIAIWLSTFLLSVPLHTKLAVSLDKPLIERLVFTNWIRTGLWSLRLILLTSVVLSRG